MRLRWWLLAKAYLIRQQEFVCFDKRLSWLRSQPDVGILGVSGAACCFGSAASINRAAWRKDQC